MTRRVAQKTLHKYCHPLPAVIPLPSVHTSGPTISGSSVVAYSARPARRWCDLKDALDSIPAEPSADQESFANRKLIRPTLTRTDHVHNNHAHSNHGHNHVPAERRDRDHDRDRDRSGGGPPARKIAPSEQTNAENFYYQKQMQSKTPMVIVLRDGEEVHGYIEWYDKNCLKLNRNGAANLMIYKPAIKYMFKEGENGRK